MFKQLHINIPFAEALEQMPKYAKFLKDVLSKKRRFSEFETVTLTEDCSAILQRKLPPKLKDPGSFNIPCNIGNNFKGKALCDLGASVNLMPSAVFNRLGLGEARPTTVTLLLADRSVSHPRGVIENVLVKVDEFIFPADFIVVDCEVDWNIPIILGRPFLATARTLIDVEKGEITLRVNDEKVSFNMNQLKFSYDSPQCAFVDVLDSTHQEKSYSSSVKNPSEALLKEEKGIEYVHGKELMRVCAMDTYAHARFKPFDPFDVLNTIDTSLNSSSKDPSILELKSSSHQCDKLEKCGLNASESARLYKENTKRWHDRKILAKEFVVGQQVLLFNSKLRLFPGKLKSRWSGPFTVVQVLDRGVVELENDEGRKFKVNGQQLKHYWSGEIDHASVSLSLSDPS